MNLQQFVIVNAFIKGMTERHKGYDMSKAFPQTLVLYNIVSVLSFKPQKTMIL